MSILLKHLLYLKKSFQLQILKHFSCEEPTSVFGISWRAKLTTEINVQSDSANTELRFSRQTLTSSLLSSTVSEESCLSRVLLCVSLLPVQGETWYSSAAPREDLSPSNKDFMINTQISQKQVSSPLLVGTEWEHQVTQGFCCHPCTPSKKGIIRFWYKLQVHHCSVLTKTETSYFISTFRYQLVTNGWHLETYGEIHLTT